MTFWRKSGSSDAGAFERLLEETRAGSPDVASDAPPPLKINLPGAMPPSRGGGGEARWRTAMAWASEGEGRAAAFSVRPSRSAPSALDVEAVKRELGLDRPLPAGERASRRRAFLWRNHPDLQPAEKRAEANARVAIANALHDKGRRER